MRLILVTILRFLAVTALGLMFLAVLPTVFILDCICTSFRDYPMTEILIAIALDLLNNIDNYE